MRYHSDGTGPGATEGRVSDSGAQRTPLGDVELAIEGIREYAIFRLGPDGTVLSWNEGAQVLKGYSKSEIIGQSFTRFYTREDLLAGQPWRLLDRAVQHGRVEDEGWRVRKDGTRFWADVVITAIRGPDGELRGFVKITRDLTARQQEQAALRQSEERMRLMIDSVKDYAIFMLDPEGRVTSWNAGAERLKGYKPREIIGESFARFYPEEDLRAGKAARELEIAAKEGRFEEEGWRVRKDGSRFWAGVVLSAVRNEKGKLVGYTKVTRDLTERKRAAEAVLARAAQQAATAQLGVYALEQPDPDALIRRAVETVRDTLGTELVQLLELGPDGNALVLRAACGVPSGAIGRVTVPFEGVTTLSKPPEPQSFGPGMPPPAALAASAIKAAIRGVGRARGMYGLLTATAAVPRPFSDDDVNFLQAIANVVAAAIERRRMEEQVLLAEQKTLEERARALQAREALRERDEFISVAAHELRTPLTALQLKLQGLERGLRAGVRDNRSSPQNFGSRLDGALRQTERLASLIERLLDVTRIASGRLELAPERFDLAALVRQVADDFKDPAAAVGSELRVDAEQPLEGSWDRLRMEQVVVNLLSNAVKYGAGRPVTVKLDTAGDRVRITVADEGIGIAPEDIDRIFTRFERAAPLRHYGGLGLGLYISRHIVDAHGGRIDVQSHLGQGSTFVVDLPLVFVRPLGAGHDSPQARA
jgi:PAS domain S-box-containing protein